MHKVVELCRSLNWHQPVDSLHEALLAAGCETRGAGKPGLRRDYVLGEIPASLREDPDQGFLFFEFYFDLVMDKSHLLDEPGRYEAHTEEGRQRWRQACEQVRALLGEPEFEGTWEEEGFPDSSPAAETAVWRLDRVVLRVEPRDDGPDLPSWLGVTVEPG